MAALNRTGIFFSFIALLLVSLIALIGVVLPTQIVLEEVKAESVIIRAGDDFTRQVSHVFLERALYIASYRALQVMENKIASGDTYSDYNDFNNQFSDLMLNGTYGPLQDQEPAMDGFFLFQKLEQLEDISPEIQRLQIEFVKDKNQIPVQTFQDNKTGPFNFGVNLTVSFYAAVDFAAWNVTATAETIFSIENLNDPLYSYNSESNQITESPYTTWNITKFWNHTYDQTYKHESNATSFIQRYYQGDQRSECCGIESPINPNKMGVPDTLKSYIDWCFWGGRCAPDTSGLLNNVTCITSWGFISFEFYRFKIDSEHLADTAYNITPYADPTATCPDEINWPPS